MDTAVIIARGGRRTIIRTIERAIVQFPRGVASCQFRDTKLDSCSRVSALLSIHCRLQKRLQASIACFDSSKPRPFAALICDFGRTRALDGGLQQDRAKHGGFEKDADL